MLFTTYDIRDCLYDNKRTKKFVQAIQKVVKHGDVVVDAGSGTGVLGLLALKAGAKKAYSIELDKRHIEVIKENARLNNYKSKVKTIHGDAKKVRLPEKVDVIICELIHTASFFEPQMQVMNNMRKFLKVNGKAIPEVMYSYIELVNAKDTFYGLKFSYDSRPSVKEVPLSNKKKFDEIIFSINEPIKLNTVVKLLIKKTGTVNAVRITGKLKITEDIYIGKSDHILMPEVVFLKKPFKVSNGDSYYLEIALDGGTDPLHANFSVKKKITKNLLKKCNYLAEDLERNL